jgi:hypothetical protein
MSEMRNPPRHAGATTGSDGDCGADDWRPVKAIALLNYAQALQEYLEEQLPGLWPGRGADKHVLAGHLVALDGLASVTSLLSAVGTGKHVDAAEFKAVLMQARAIFAESGMIGGERLALADSIHDGDAASPDGMGWSLPRWCIEKLCDGMEELSSDAPETRGAEPQV